MLTPKQASILSYLGLHIGNLGYRPPDFTYYVTEEYRNSKRREEDEAYRMFEGNLMHTLSGLRITYTITEDYYGESASYRVIAVFIILNNKERREIVDANFDREVFETADGIVPFKDVDKAVGET